MSARTRSPSPPADDVAHLRELLRAREEEVAVLREQARELERATEQKTRFIGHVSHEFRTPLSSIIGFASLLAARGGELPEEDRAEYLGTVLRNARHLLHVVNDILNLSKVEAGTLEVSLAPVRAGELARAVATSLEPAAAERGIRIRVSDLSRRTAMADAGRLRQVLINLLDNAVKYSPPHSEVEVVVSGGEERVRLEVRDLGPGIAPEDRDRLFKEFSRIPQAGVRVAGAGLGLALAKLLTGAMGGEIGVDSQPGRGSTFWVTLPAGAEVAPAAPDAAPATGVQPPARSGVVAVVDDDADIRSYAEAILGMAGYGVAADEGRGGVGERVARAAPALVLLDLNLAGRSGLEALAEIRARPELAGVPVVAFTADATAPDVEHYRALGFDGCLIKPVEPETLLAKIDQVLERATAELRSPPPPAAPERRAAPPPPEDDYLAPLRARFRAGLADRLVAMRGCAAARDLDGLRRECHKLRGTSAGYGEAELSRLAGAAEDALEGAAARAEHPAVAVLLEQLAAMVEEGTAPGG